MKYAATPPSHPLDPLLCTSLFVKCKYNTMSLALGHRRCSLVRPQAAADIVAKPNFGRSSRRRGRPRTDCMNNTKTWTGLSVEESIRMTEIKWRKYVVMVWPTLLGSRTAKEQNRTEQP